MHTGRRASLVRSWLAVLTALVLVLTGCASIPTSSPVGTSQADSGDDAFTNYTFSPRGPIQDADPDRIVQGFITAATGAQEDYRVAREFLTPSRAQTWNADERTIIYRGDPKIVPTASEDRFLIQLETFGIIDAQGILRQSEAGASETVEVSLVRVDGQWRIDGIANGIMVSETNFSLLFRSHNLYFYSSDYAYAVPDVRWFVSRQAVSAAIVKAMLNGPAPYLKGAVASAFPEGSTLVRNAVPIVSGEATVDLSAEILDDTTNLQRQQMQRQLELTLVGLNTISAVNMTVDQRSVELGPPETGLAVPVKNPSVGSSQIAVYQNELTYYQGSQLDPIENLPSVAAFAPRDPAMTYDQRRMAFLNGDRTQLLSVAPGQQVQVGARGTELTAPSFDPQGWLWTASGDRQGRVLAVPPRSPAGPAMAVAAPWLADWTVKDLRISRDGARAVIVAEQAGAAVVLVSGITRDVDGAPQSLNAPVQLQASVPVDSARWVSEDSVVVMKAAPSGPVQAEVLRLGNEPVRIAPLDGMMTVSAGNGTQDIYAQTPEAIFVRVGNSWVPQTEGVKDPAFPG
jgi:hypothetical protein